jgi:NADPH:quinone reductase-like Zn-dependent oxidoreductase
MAVQLAREIGAYVIGTGRAAHREIALDFGINEFVDLDGNALEDIDKVDLVFDVLGGDIAKRSLAVIRKGGKFVSITGWNEEQVDEVQNIDFVVEADRSQLVEIAKRFREGRLKTNIGKVITFDNAIATYNSTDRVKGKIIVHVRS